MSNDTAEAALSRRRRRLPVFETRLAKVAEGSERYRSQAITSTSECCRFVSTFLGGYFSECCDQEEFHVLTLDTKHKPTGSFRVTRGTLDASLVHPREVFRPAILAAAAAVILIHNHPSGDCTPSREDHQVTDRLTEAGKLIGVSVLDHIIVGSDGATLSIREAA